MRPLERFEYYTSRIERLNPSLNAFLDLRIGAARQDAEASEKRLQSGKPLSPIDGFCIGVKANVAVEGLPCHAGIGAYKDELAPQDAATIAKLRAAGAVMLGTLNMHEGALGATTDNAHFGRCMNPWKAGVTPGGSSGGSGSAVAANLCDMAIGSDTMGSVRIPAAYCGVQGHKPTMGFVPEKGVLPLSPTLDHIGPLCRSVETLAATLFPMVGQSLDAPLRQPSLRGMRIGVWDGDGDVDLTQDVATGFARAVEKVSAAGAKTTSFVPPVYEYGRSRRAGLIISEVEGHAVHADRLKAAPDGFSDTFRGLLEWGASKADEKLEPALAHIETVRRVAMDVWSDVDLIIAPTAPQTAFPFGADIPANQADFTAWSNFAGLPATALFTGLSADGLPLSLQVIGASGSDRRVLEVALAIEALFGKPPLPPNFT